MQIFLGEHQGNENKNHSEIPPHPHLAIVKETDNDSSGEDEEKFKLSCIAGGNVKQYCHFGTQSGGSSKKLKRGLSCGPRNSTRRYVPKIIENMCPHQDLYTNDTAAASM